MNLVNEPEGDLVARWNMPLLHWVVRHRSDGLFYLDQRHAGQRR